MVDYWVSQEICYRFPQLKPNVQYMYQITVKPWKICLLIIIRKLTSLTQPKKFKKWLKWVPVVFSAQIMGPGTGPPAMGAWPVLQRKSHLCMYSFSGNYAASVPISAFMCLWETYIFPGLVHIFSCSRLDRPILEICINLSQIYECRKGTGIQNIITSSHGSRTWNGNLLRRE